MNCLYAAPLIAVTLLGQAEADEAVAAIFSSQVFGKKYTVTVTQSALAKAPVWDEAENPPLSAKKAAEFAIAMKDSLAKDSPGVEWELESLSLVKVRYQQRWLWKASFAGKKTARERSNWREIQFLKLAVLMDGTVIQPAIEQISD